MPSRSHSLANGGANAAEFLDQSFPRIALPEHLPKKVERIGAERLCDRDEFRHVDLALVALNHANDGILPFQKSGQISLGEFLLLPCTGKNLGYRPGRYAARGLHSVCAPIYWARYK